MCIKEKDEIELYCMCRMPEVIPMIQCSYCEQWYHIACLQEPVLQAVIEDSNLEWTCRLCMYATVV